MATAPSAYSPPLEYTPTLALGNSGLHRTMASPQSAKLEGYASNRRDALMPVTDQRYWNSLMRKAQSGCKKSYGYLLHEIDAWLDHYLVQVGFAGQRDSIVMEVLQAVHDKIATYDREVSVISWLTAIADFKIANASPKRSKTVGQIGAIFVRSQRALQEENQS